jgi:hypothetical protein
MYTYIITHNYNFRRKVIYTGLPANIAKAKELVAQVVEGNLYI